MKRSSAVATGLLVGLVYGIVRHPGALLLLLLILAVFGAVFVYAAYSWLAGYIGPGGVAAAAIGLTLRWTFLRNRRRGPAGPDQAPPK